MLGLFPAIAKCIFLAKIWVLHLAKISKTNHRILQKGMWPVGNIYICVIGVGPSYLIVKNGDIGNHGFSKLKVSSTLKYLSPLGQDVMPLRSCHLESYVALFTPEKAIIGQ